MKSLILVLSLILPVAVVASDRGHSKSDHGSTQKATQQAATVTVVTQSANSTQSRHSDSHRKDPVVVVVTTGNQNHHKDRSCGSSGNYYPQSYSSPSYYNNGYNSGYSSGYDRTYSNNIRTDNYGTSQVGQVGEAEEGVVVAVRGVSVVRSSTGTGPLIGAVAGGVIGSNVSSHHNKNLGTVLGALVGASVGSQVERRSTVQGGTELVVRVGGRLISVTQGNDEYLRVGDTVFVIRDSSGRTRVIRG